MVSSEVGDPDVFDDESIPHMMGVLTGAVYSLELSVSKMVRRLIWVAGIAAGGVWATALLVLVRVIHEWN